jgi:hypothetical protein
MSTDYPTDLDNFTNPQPSDSMETVSHSSQHSDINDAVEAVQAKIGADDSPVQSSHDYKLSSITGSDKASSTSKDAEIDLNTTHRGSDGSDHSKVGDNETAIGLNTTHRSSDGSDHSFLDQSVVSGATPILGNDNITEAADKNYVTDAEKTVISTTSGTNTGDQVLPVKASDTEIDTGTDDAKFATSKALKDSKNVPSVVPSTSGNVLTSDGTDWTSAAPDPVSPLTTKGDLYGYDSADTRIPVGADNQHLLADSNSALGIKWTNPSATVSIDDLLDIPAPYYTGFITTNQMLTVGAGNYYAKLTIDNTKVAGTGDHTDFPVLVSGIYDGAGRTPNFRHRDFNGNIENATTGGAGGNIVIPADLAFYDDASKTTQYDHEIEKWNPETGELIAWVRIPTLKWNSDTDFYVHFGDSTKTVSQENVNGVWDSDYIGVWHFGEQSGTIHDSTSNANDSEAQSNVEQGTSEQLIGSGIYQNEGWSDSFIRIPDSASLDTASLTMELLHKAYSVSEKSLIARHSGLGINLTPFLLATTGTNYQIYLSTGSFSVWDTGITMPTGTDTYVALRHDSGAGRPSLWLENAEVWNTSYAGSLVTGTNTLFLGNAQNGDIPPTAGSDQPGWDFDEVRMSGIARSDDWLETNYNCLRDNSNFYSMGLIATAGSSFILQNYPITDSELVYLNGNKLTITTDYTISGNSLDMIVAPSIADSLLISSSTNAKDVINPQPWVTASDSGTVTFDLSLGIKQRVTLEGNRTLAVSNVRPGHTFILKLTQDITGSRTPVWFAGISWDNGTVPTLTTTQYKSDTFGFIQTGTNTYDGVIVSQNT